MTPAEIATIHASCFITPRPWSEAEISALLDNPHIFFLGDSKGFAMGRVVLEQAELLTLAINPTARRQGLGRHWLREYHAEAKSRGATESFLEVAANNHAAHDLYRSEGYLQTGQRPRYYRHPNGQPIDAYIFSRSIT